MGPWIFLMCVAAVIAGAALICTGVGGESSYDYAKNCRVGGRNERVWLFLPGHLLLWPGLVLVLAFGILWPAQYFSSLGNVQELEAFAETRCAYVQAIEQAEAVVIAGAATEQDNLLDLAYQQQAQRYTDLVQDLRDRTEWYNRGLQRVDALRDAPLVGGFRVGASHLGPITDAFGGCP